MRLAVVGDPVEHSRSPQLHRAFLREASIDGTSVAIRVAQDDAVNVLRRMRLDGYTGANVTTPLKATAMDACDQLTDEAKRCGAVNTVFFGAHIVGHNTDGIGARTALEALLDEPVALKRIGVLGYGSTARAVLAQLQENDVYTFAWGRDAARLDAVCERYDARPWDASNPPEIILSTLPPLVQLEPFLLTAIEHADFVMDANYGDRCTLQRQVEREVVAGDGMLEAQARASFDFWLAHLDGVAAGANSA